MARRRQCPKCPWRVDVDPRAIPDGYDVEKHRALRRTIAEPGELPSGPLHLMACHESPKGAEQACVGWLANQLGPGNNIALRLAAQSGRVNADFELRGAQHARFEDTLPEDP